jgi:hypothetical protein
MKLYLIGVHHYDPLGRSCLKRILQQLGDANGGLPSFLALEWDKKLFADLVSSERPRLREFAQSEWQDIPPKVLTSLERTLGYEAETPIEHFPSTEVLWLDNGRQGSVGGLADHWFQIYKDILGVTPGPMDWESALLRMSEGVLKQVEDNQKRYDRDARWADCLQKRLKDAVGDFALVIVGALHLGDDPKRLRKLLDSYRQSYEVIFCKPQR